MGSNHTIEHITIEPTFECLDMLMSEYLRLSIQLIHARRAKIELGDALAFIRGNVKADLVAEGLRCDSAEFDERFKQVLTSNNEYMDLYKRGLTVVEEKQRCEAACTAVSGLFAVVASVLAPAVDGSVIHELCKGVNGDEY